MAGKVILYIFGTLLTISESLITDMTPPGSYSNVGAGRTGFGIIFLIIGAMLIRAGSAIKTKLC